MVRRCGSKRSPRGCGWCCNLEDTDHAARRLRDPEQQAGWLRAVREAASAAGYGLVINARVDTFLAAILAGPDPETQSQMEWFSRALAPLAAEASGRHRANQT